MHRSDQQARPATLDDIDSIEGLVGEMYADLAEEHTGTRPALRADWARSAPRLRAIGRRVSLLRGKPGRLRRGSRCDAYGRRAGRTVGWPDGTE